MPSTTNLRATRKQAAVKVTAVQATPARKAAAGKATAPATPAPAAPVAKAVEVAAIPIPKDAEALRHLIGVQKARRYRAGRRGDPALVALLDERLELLGASVQAPQPETAKVPIPADAGELHHLIGVQKARRWRAGRRGDEALVAMLTERIALLQKAVKK